MARVSLPVASLLLQGDDVVLKGLPLRKFISIIGKGHQTEHRKSLSWLLDLSDLPGDEWELRYEWTWRSGVGGKTEAGQRGAPNRHDGCTEECIPTVFRSIRNSPSDADPIIELRRECCADAEQGIGA